MGSDFDDKPCITAPIKSSRFSSIRWNATKQKFKLVHSSRQSANFATKIESTIERAIRLDLVIAKTKKKKMSSLEKKSENWELGGSFKFRGPKFLFIIFLIISPTDNPLESCILVFDHVFVSGLLFPQLDAILRLCVLNYASVYIVRVQRLMQFA